MIETRAQNDNNKTAGPGEAHDLLLEIGTEEIPSRFMPNILEQLKDKSKTMLAEQRLACQAISTFGTPRRLVLYVTDLAAKQPDQEEKKKGPASDRAFDKNGSPTAAAHGFAAKLGLEVHDLEIERTEKGEYLVAVQKTKGLATNEILKEILPGLIKSLSFPKNMYWETSKFRFARPIRWLLCLYGTEPVEIQCAGLSGGFETRGHRFLAPGPFKVNNPDHYFALLPEMNVVLDQRARANLVKEGVKAAAASCGVKAVLDPELLDEVTYLVEQPQAILCSFPETYLALPREVLVTTMQSHQRYFPLEDDGGNICSYFVAVSNNPGASAKEVRAGNEKVLKARLADARFFYEEDRRISLAKRIEMLKDILFQEKLGTVYDKMERIVALTAQLADRITEIKVEDKETAIKAARLAKVDLTTHMVGEFPELQGVMGREYALSEGEDKKTADAIYEHYLPRFTGDVLPRSRAGALVALADKIDHLAGCFAAGIRSTGSQDPYALRRQSLGLIQVLLENTFRLSYIQLMEDALKLYKDRLPALDIKETTNDIKDFTWQRLRHYLQEQGIAYDVVEGVLETSVDDIVALSQRAHFLQAKCQDPELAQAAAAYTRVNNLAAAAKSGNIDETILQEAEEKALYSQYLEMEPIIRSSLAAGNFTEVLTRLASFKERIDTFFDAVLVMSKDDKLRNNRLALLYCIKKVYLQFADFAKFVFTSD